MATLTRCDICRHEYDPATTYACFEVTNPSVAVRLDTPDLWDICSPRCLSTLASRRDPTLANPPSTLSDDVATSVHDDLRWVVTALGFALDEDASPETSERLVANALSRVRSSLARFGVEHESDDGTDDEADVSPPPG